MIAQRQSNSFHSDVFTPIIDAVSEATGVRYSRDEPAHAAHRVIADHARSVAFLLADGVFPSNEGRGYVLRRILRRAVRNAWLLDVKRPVLYFAVDAVVKAMGDAYPELRQRRKHLVDTTRAEEERFLATIEGGMRRFEELAPLSTTDGSPDLKGTIAGEDAFRLYDTFGFPIDLTQLMAAERGYTVDIPGFERALAAQRTQSQQERKSKKLAVSATEDLVEGWEIASGPELTFGARTAKYEVAAPSRGAVSSVAGASFVRYD